MGRYLDGLYRRSGVSLYTLEEVARGSGLTARQLLQCIQRGYLKATQVRGRWCIEAAEVDRFTEHMDEYTRISVR